MTCTSICEQARLCRETSRPKACLVRLYSIFRRLTGQEVWRQYRASVWLKPYRAQQWWFMKCSQPSPIMPPYHVNRICMALFASTLLTLDKSDTVKKWHEIALKGNLRSSIILSMESPRASSSNSNYGLISHGFGDRRICPPVLDLTRPLGAANDTGTILILRCMLSIKMLYRSLV